MNHGAVKVTEDLNLHVARMLDDPDFWQYLGNTLFLMMSIPFAIAGSLVAAILLSQDTDGGSGWVRRRLIASAGLVFGVSCLVLAGAGVSAVTILIVGLAGAILLGGTTGGWGAMKEQYQKAGRVGSRRWMTRHISRAVQLVGWQCSGRCQGRVSYTLLPMAWVSSCPP